MSETSSLEHGFTQIAHQLLEEFAKIYLCGNESKILWTVLRKTYGFHKKEDSISISQFAKFTGMSRSAVVRSVASLVARKILLETKGKINRYGINEDVNLWLASITSVTDSITDDTSIAHSTTLVSPTVPEVVSPTVHTKYNIKDNIQKIAKDKSFAELSKGIKINGNPNDATTRIKERTSPTKKDVNFFIGLMKDINPLKYESFFSNKTERKSCQNLIDKLGAEKLEEIILKLPEINSQAYVPTSTSFTSLERNFAIYVFKSKEEKERSGIVYV